jgi:hypothetical protein
MNKKLISKIIIFFYPILAVWGNEYYNIERIGIDLNGVCNNSKIVVAYGTNGIILISNDFGDTWYQKQIFPDSTDINDLILVNDEFVGSGSNFIFKLDKDGNLVNKKDFPDLKSSCNIAANDEYICVLKQKQEIEVIDNDLKTINKIPIDTTLSILDIHIFKNKLYLCTNFSLIITYDLLENYKVEIFDIGKYGNFAFDLQSDNEFLYGLINNSLYILNEPDNFILKGKYVENYNVFNNEIYLIKIGKNNSWSVSWLDFYKINNDLTQTKINLDSIDRYVNTSVRDWKYINDNVIIAVGPNKTIYLSKDGGKNWEIKSYFDFKTKSLSNSIWLNRKNGYFTNSSQIFRTTNAGSTWLPQKFTDTLISHFNHVNGFYMDSTGKGFAYCGYPEYNPDSSKRLNFLFTVDSGNTFKSKWILELIGNTTNQFKISKTPDGYLVIFPFISLMSHNYSTNFVVLDSNYSIINYRVLDSLSISCLELKNNVITAFAEEKRFPNSNGGFDSLKYWILKSYDSYKSWVKTLEIKFPNGLHPYCQILNNDDAFIWTVETLKNNGNDSTFTYLYWINTEKAEMNMIYKGYSSKNNFIFKYKNGVYISNYNNNILKCSNYSNDNPEWDSVFFINSNHSSLLRNLWFDDSILYVMDYYSNLNNIIKLNIDKVTGVSEDIEISKPYIYAEPVYPTPSANYAKIVIYETTEIDIDHANISIYDLFGNRINQKQNIIRYQYDNFKSEIRWDCSNINSGLYIINIDFKTTSICVPVIVVK